MQSDDALGPTRPTSQTLALARPAVIGWVHVISKHKPPVAPQRQRSGGNMTSAVTGTGKQRNLKRAGALPNFTAPGSQKCQPVRLLAGICIQKTGPAKRPGLGGKPFRNACRRRRIPGNAACGHRVWRIRRRKLCRFRRTPLIDAQRAPSPEPQSGP